MNEQDAQFFFVEAESFNEGQSFEEYNQAILRYLQLSSWHYSEETARGLMKIRADYIQEAYSQREPVTDAAVEVGYCCG